MARFELSTFSIGNNCSSNCAAHHWTTTIKFHCFFSCHSGVWWYTSFVLTMQLPLSEKGIQISYLLYSTSS